MSSSEVPGVLAFVNNIETDRAYKVGAYTRPLLSSTCALFMG